MDKNVEKALPRYQQIAVDIAARIAEGFYEEGVRLSGRSTIASQYRVSPETARRAFCVLSDVGIVRAEPGAGMVVISRDAAASFIKQFDSLRSLETIKDNIMASIMRQQKETERLSSYLAELLTATHHYRAMNPLMPFSLEITASCRYLNQTIEAIGLWQHTGATVVGIRRKDNLLTSPGPYATLQEGDTLYAVLPTADDTVLQRFLYGNNA